ncbi:unnamed protein product [Rotaria magnacalcarata]|uniref:Uncharacterized protein n=4 Tax=Rotaria magnacalcarata TaxID=392030 RepID=A0A816AQB5_9BILA|nr:unnamed protein product [Rotaria magnacalcarata]CAF1597878.1 unnamed protein product [Rotaria magnacalcarata]CAF2047318.1 unnamed protein product [Rotaria magnacalcarata]CAF4783593.1 unnamed protein product [Rotaria magnacalcarata]
MPDEIEIQNSGTNNVVKTEPVVVVVQKHRLSSIMPIIVFSYIGVLIRVGLNFLGNIQAPLSAAFWSNFVGCFIMGFVVEQKVHIQKHFPQLYVGLTTGLCGSITTFSGLMYNSCVALFGPSSHATYPISNYLAVMISVLSSSFIGFIIGRHISVFILSPLSLLLLSNAISKVQYLNERVCLWLFPVLIIISIPLLVLLAVLLPIGHYTYFIYSVIFAPFGSLTRYILSIVFNTNANFPLGTLFANVIGSYIYFGLVTIQEYVYISSPLVTQVIIGIIQGYCGCLTTVSTFMLELDTIKRRSYIYAYVIITLLPIQIVYIILGDIFTYICSPKA